MTDTGDTGLLISWLLRVQNSITIGCGFESRPKLTVTVKSED